MTITFDTGFPAELSGETSRLFAKYAGLLPSWCWQVFIEYDRDLPCLAQVSVNEPYHRCTVSLGVDWLNNPDERDHCVVHELCHLYNVPISRIAREMVEDFFPDGPTPGTRMFDRVIQETMERTNGELEKMVLRLLEQQLVCEGAQI